MSFDAMMSQSAHHTFDCDFINKISATFVEFSDSNDRRLTQPVPGKRELPSVFAHRMILTAKNRSNDYR